MKRLFTPVLMFTLSLAAGPAAFAHDYSAGDLQIDHPWSRATPMVAPVAGGYLKITNTGAESDTFLGGSSPIATAVEVHELTFQDGVARMRPLTAGVTIKPGETVELAPGATHLMFIKPTKVFKEGEKVEATLRFEKAGEIKVEFAVQGMGAKQPAENEDHQGHGATP